MIKIRDRRDGILVGDNHQVCRQQAGDQRRWVVYNTRVPMYRGFVAAFEVEDLAIQFAYEQEILSMQMGDMRTNDNFLLSCLAYGQARAALWSRKEEALEEMQRVRTEELKGSD